MPGDGRRGIGRPPGAVGVVVLLLFLLPGRALGQCVPGACL